MQHPRFVAPQHLIGQECVKLLTDFGSLPIDVASVDRYVRPDGPSNNNNKKLWLSTMDRYGAVRRQGPSTAVGMHSDINSANSQNSCPFSRG